MVGNHPGAFQGALPSPNFDAKDGTQESPFTQIRHGHLQLWSSGQNCQPPLWSTPWSGHCSSFGVPFGPAVNMQMFGNNMRGSPPKRQHSFPRMNNYGHGYSARFQPQMRQHFNSSAPKPFCCDPCNKAFERKEDLDAHLAEHTECGIGGCIFKAHPKIVALHQKMQHDTGLAKKIMSLDTPEEIRKWREERRRNFPTAANIAKHKAEEMEKEARGEILQTKEFGKVRRPLRGRGGFRSRGRGRGFHHGVPSRLHPSSDVAPATNNHTLSSTNVPCSRQKRTKFGRCRPSSNTRNVSVNQMPQNRTFTYCAENEEENKRGLKRFRGTCYNYADSLKEHNDEQTVPMSLEKNVDDVSQTPNGHIDVTSKDNATHQNDFGQTDNNLDQDDECSSKVMEAEQQKMEVNDLYESDPDAKDGESEMLNELLHKEYGTVLEEINVETFPIVKNNAPLLNSGVTAKEIIDVNGDVTSLNGEVSSEVNQDIIDDKESGSNSYVNDKPILETSQVRVKNISDDKEEGELTDCDDDDVSASENANQSKENTTLHAEACSSSVDIDDLDEINSPPLSLPARQTASLHSQLGGSLGLLMSSYANSDSDSEGEIHSDNEVSKKQPEKCKKTIKKHVNSYPINKRHSTLLEKLLAKEIRHERNVILQCVHYIVKKDFFKIQ